MAILVIGLLIPYTDPQLLRTEVTDVSVSPFALIFERAGLLAAASVMNAVVLTSGCCRPATPACTPPLACCTAWRATARRPRCSVA